MNYLETLAYIESLSPTLERPSLTRIAAFMQEYSDQHSRLPVFHVGGTNGKGSTAAILDALLRQCGLRVGRFTGPHLLRWNERFHVNGLAISDFDFARIATDVRRLSEDFAQEHPGAGTLTWFEFLAAVAFFYFAECRVDVAVLEVGLGGRFDATNIVENVLCSIITNIDLDHTHILGETEEEIAFEKGGILKRSVPAVTATKGRALETLKRRAMEVGTSLYVASPPSALCLTADNSSQFLLNDAEWLEAAVQFSKACRSLILLGEHQQVNALLALSSLYLARKSSKHFKEILPASALSQANLSEAFSHVYWPGRLQPVPNRQNVYLDGAHNPAGARTLRLALDQLYNQESCCFVMACFANKNAGEMVRSLVRPGDQVFVSEAGTRRATMSKEKLAALAESLGAKAHVYHSILAAFTAALGAQTGEQPVVAAGSFATVSEIMIGLGWRCVEDGRVADQPAPQGKLSRRKK